MPVQKTGDAADTDRRGYRQGPPSSARMGHRGRFRAWCNQTKIVTAASELAATRGFMRAARFSWNCKAEDG